MTKLITSSDPIVAMLREYHAASRALQAEYDRPLAEADTPQGKARFHAAEARSFEAHADFELLQQRVASAHIMVSREAVACARRLANEKDYQGRPIADVQLRNFAKRLFERHVLAQAA